MSARGKQVFISYARQDQDKVRALAGGLRQLGCQVWLDEALTGGMKWWDTILAHIQSSDIVVVAVSPSSLQSVAVSRESQYARSLGLALLPVIVEHVHFETLPAELAIVQAVDFVQSGMGGATAAVFSCPDRARA